MTGQAIETLAMVAHRCSATLASGNLHKPFLGLLKLAVSINIQNHIFKILQLGYVWLQGTEGDLPQHRQYPFLFLSKSFGESSSSVPLSCI
jgi:hypothetical protein